MSQLLINIPRKQAFVYAGFCVFYEFLTYIANDMIMPGMIKVVASFHGPESAIATSLTAYLLGGASLQLFLGPISERYGRRPVMIFGAFFFLMCTIFIAFSNSIHQFLIARYFQGMGLCFIGVVGYATIQEIFEEMDAIRLIAVMANIAVVAPLIGPLLGAVFIYYYSWRFIFALIGIGALFALWGLWRYMPESATLSDDKKIRQQALSARTIVSNYLSLLINPIFMLGSIGLGVVTLPCLIWIALSPIILVTEAKLSIIQYGVWQLPVFGSYLIGNFVLRHLTHLGSVKKLVGIGSLFAGISLPFMFILPYLFGHSYLWLMPGLIVYFFGLGVLSAPLNRFILFSTEVGKGTASALMSMIDICILGVGIEIGNNIYASHNNLHLGIFCAIISAVYLVFLSGALLASKHPP